MIFSLVWESFWHAQFNCTLQIGARDVAFHSKLSQFLAIYSVLCLSTLSLAVGEFLQLDGSPILRFLGWNTVLV